MPVGLLNWRITGRGVQRESFHPLPRQLYRILPRLGAKEEDRHGSLRVGDGNSGGHRLPDSGKASHVRLPCERGDSTIVLRLT